MRRAAHERKAHEVHAGREALCEIPPVFRRQGGRREGRIGEVHARPALHAPADLDGREERAPRALLDPQADPPVVEPHLGAWADVREESRIRHREAHGGSRLAGGGGARKELDGPPGRERHGAAGQRAEADLRAAEVEEDARRGAPRTGHAGGRAPPGARFRRGGSAPRSGARRPRPRRGAPRARRASPRSRRSSRRSASPAPWTSFRVPSASAFPRMMPA